MQKLDAYLTIKRAARFLGVSTNTLRNWCQDGKMPTHRNPINGYRLFKRIDLESLLNRIALSKTRVRRRGRHRQDRRNLLAKPGRQQPLF